MHLNYDDILLEPNICAVDSRSECDTSLKLGEHMFNLPVIPANMATIINEELAEALAEKGYFYILHRFGVDAAKFVSQMKEKGLISSISTGVSQSSYIDLTNLSLKGLIPDYITLDIAHAHAQSATEMIQYIRVKFPSTFIIAGNVCTSEGTKFLQRAGADAIKCGIGNGGPCTTKYVTGFGKPQFSTIQECSLETLLPVIADGGVKHHGDIAKALVAGATAVMAGSIFAAHDESPGEFFGGEDAMYKEYYGSASAQNKGFKKHIEGKAIWVKEKGSIWDTLTEIEENLKSSISYAGGTNLDAFKYVKYTVVK